MFCNRCAFFLIWGYFIGHLVIFSPLPFHFTVFVFCFTSLAPMPDHEEDFIFKTYATNPYGSYCSLTMPTNHAGSKPSQYQPHDARLLRPTSYMLLTLCAMPYALLALCSALLCSAMLRAEGDARVRHAHRRPLARAVRARGRECAAAVAGDRHSSLPY